MSKYQNLDRFLEKKGLKLKAEENKATKEMVIAEYKEKEKVKKLTQEERLTRIEKILGL
ncbi:MAG: hypothetical protein KMY55_09950 [Dethiosulfatibacter sp.]|nr:hypothetical protein [Dethiosulfatibacter sp.]